MSRTAAILHADLDRKASPKQKTALRALIQQGDEMGRFLLGSTVVLLFPRGPLVFNPQWAPAGAIRMGEKMGTRG